MQISAKESRRRKVSYVEGLEKRVKMCTMHNMELMKKVDNLEKQNGSVSGRHSINLVRENISIIITRVLLTRYSVFNTRKQERSILYPF